MNYIKQLNEFYSMLDYKPLSSTAISIYYMLLQVDNRTGWLDKFNVANNVLMSKCNLDVSKLARARNELINQGYINYKKGKNQTIAPTYSIIQLYDDIADDRANDKADDIANSMADDGADGNINKQNKTKKNKTKNNNINKYKYINNAENNLVDDDVQRLNNALTNSLGITNMTTIQECISYLDELPADVIEIALKKTAENNAKWKYTKAILNDWIKAGINTPEKVKAYDLEFKKQKEPKQETDEEWIARHLARDSERRQSNDKR